MHSNVKKVELLKEHNLGMSKYRSLYDGGNEIHIPEYKGVSDEIMEQYKMEIEEQVGCSITVEVCRI